MNKIMTKKQKLFCDYMEKIEAIVESNELTFINKNDLQTIKRKIIETELLIPVIGPFSAGKSTIINELLQEDLLPVGIAPETELATEIRYSETPKLIGVKKDGDEEEFPVEQLHQMNKRSNEFLFLRLYINNAFPKEIFPFILVDMPGFGSSLENHNKAISFYLLKGVHFIVVVSVEDGSIHHSMIHQLREIANHGLGFSIFISKTNIRPESTVKEITEYIKDQVERYFEFEVDVQTLKDKGDKKITEYIKRLNPNEIFNLLFTDELKTHNIEIIQDINIAISTLKKDSQQVKRELEILEDALQQIELQQDAALSEIRRRFSIEAQNRCIKNIQLAFQENIDELVALILNNQVDLFSNTITQITRNSLADTLQKEIDATSQDIINLISQRLSAIDVSGIRDPRWASELATNVKNSLYQSIRTIENLQKIIEKKDNYKKLFNILSTLLAVLTNIIHPIIEIIIIFMPQIIDFFAKANQPERVRQKILTEVLPSITSELRRNLPGILEEEANRLSDVIKYEFSAQIAKQQEIIKNFQQTHGAKKEEIMQKIEKLTTARESIQHLANEYLYA